MPSSRHDLDDGDGLGPQPPDDLVELHQSFDLVQAPAGSIDHPWSAVVRLVRRLLQPVLTPILSRATAYNGANARLSSELVRRTQVLSDQVERLTHTLESMRVELSDKIVTEMRWAPAGQVALASELRGELNDLRCDLATETQRQVSMMDDARNALLTQIEHLEREQTATMEDIRAAIMSRLGLGDGRRTMPLDRAPRPDLSGHHVLVSELDARGLVDDDEDRARHRDAVLVAFNRRLRGKREVITERLRVFLPYVREIAEVAAVAPMIEIGCGRGEWLQLCREERIRARGVDANPLHVDACRADGLDVRLAEGVTYLSSLPAASAAAVVGFHVVEHLSFPALIELFVQARRVIVPGGLFILETPNPGNVLVGACNFYLDPSHMRPLPSALLSFLAEEHGLSRVVICDLHPNDDNAIVEPANEGERRLNHFFYGPRDYALIARG